MNRNQKGMVFRVARILNEGSHVTANLRSRDWESTRIRSVKEDLLEEEEFKSLKKILKTIK